MFIIILHTNVERVFPLSLAESLGIAERLKWFGQQKFGAEHGWKKHFADALGISPQHLDRYLSGASEPGNKMYLRLIQLGCDVHWLLTGKALSAHEGISGEEREMLAELRKAGIHAVEQVRYVLNPERLAEDIAAAAVKDKTERGARLADATCESSSTEGMFSRRRRDPAVAPS